MFDCRNSRCLTIDALLKDARKFLALRVGWFLAGAHLFYLGAYGICYCRAPL